MTVESPRSWHRRFLRRLPALPLVGLLLVALAAPAGAAVTQLQFRNSSDGTPGWDPAPGPGLDTGPDNRVVRTNDRFEYLVTYSTDGASDRLALVAALPAGTVAPRVGEPVARWSYLPASCLAAGSAISPDGQVLTCDLGAIDASETRSLFLNATVLGTTPNGTTLGAPRLEIASETMPPLAPAMPPEALTVTAAPFYDVVVQMSYQGNPRAYSFQPGGGPTDEDGFYHRPLVGLVARNPNGNGAKGVEQLAPGLPVRFVVDVSGYPAGVRLDDWHDGSAPAGTPAATGTFASGCGSNAAGAPSVESGGAVNVHDRVRDVGGSASTAIDTVPGGGVCVNPVQSGTRIAFDVNGIDTRLQRRPERTGGSAQSPVPESEWWVSNKALVLWTPLDSYPADVNQNHVIRLESVSAQSISGQPVTGDRPENNAASYLLRTLDTGSASKLFSADTSVPEPYRTSCDPAIVGNCHVNYMTPGQAVRSSLNYQNRGTVPHTGVWLCEVIDRTAFDIGAGFGVSLGWSGVSPVPPLPVVRYGARAGGPFFASIDTAADPYASGVPGTSDYATARCDDPSIQWFDTAEEAEAAGGLVHVRADAPVAPPSAMLSLYVRGLVLRDTWGATIQVQTPQPATRRSGQPIAEGTILRNRGDVGSSLASMNGVSIRDHLEVVRLRTTSRIAKQVVEPADGETAPQAVGTTLTYRLQPRYSTLFPPVPGTVTVTDVLPPDLSYLAGSATVGGVAHEPVVAQDTPAPGYTRLVWTLPGQVPHLGADGVAAGLAPIEFRAAIAVTSPDSTVLANAAAISGGATDAEPDCAYDAATQGFGACVKAAVASVTVQTPPGFKMQKTALAPMIEPGAPFRYRLDYVSFGAELAAIDIPHFIDILPFDGDGAGDPGHDRATRSPGSRFLPGAYRLLSVAAPASDPGMRVYYTNRPPAEIHNDPRDPGNAIPGGATRWCLAGEFGAPGCPADIGQSTAVRFAPGVARMPAGQVYGVEMVLQSVDGVARPGDVFANTAGGRSPDPASSLLYVGSPANTNVIVVESSLAGSVFDDLDDDGVRDEGEPGIAGVAITLEGCRSGADGVLQTAAIAPAGAVACSGDDVAVRLAGVTGPDGSYAFTGLRYGIYRITEEPPSGYLDGKTRAGSAGGSASGQGTDPSVITDIRLPMSAEATGYVFGELRIPRVSVTKSAEPPAGSTVLPGQLVTYALAVTLADAPTRNEVTLADTLGEGLEFVDGSFTIPPGADCSHAARLVSCELPAGAAIGTHVFTYQARIAAGARGSVANTVVPAGVENPACAAAADCTTSHPVASAAVVVSKTASPATGSPVLPGQTVEYALAVTVSEAPTRAGTTLVDTLGAGLEFVPGSFASPPGADCSVAGPVVTCQLPAGAPVGTHAFRYQATVAAAASAVPASTGITNTVVPAGDDGPVCATPGDCAIAHPVDAVLLLGKTALGEAVPVAGDPEAYDVAYELTVRNTGGSTGTYTLADLPGLDPDATVVAATVQRDAGTAEALAGPGPWMLAAEVRLEPGAQARYRMQLRLRVATGSDVANDHCGTEPGNGLYNAAQLVHGTVTRHASACIDTPVPVAATRLVLEKTSPVREAELGDLVTYTVRIRNTGPGTAVNPVLVDHLPTGFALLAKSVRVRGARLVALAGDPGPTLQMTLDRIGAGEDALVQYRVRLGVGAQQGNGINRARVECRSTPQPAPCSNEGRWRIDVRGGVFSDEGCIVGQIFVDTNGNSLKDREELGIPGVRLYFEDGTWLVSDIEGKYSYCGLRATTHVLKVDPRTLPRGSRLVTSSHRNAGDAGSLFIDLKNGELQRADFIEGSASNLVIEQVKARRTASDTGAVATEPGQPALKFESKPAPQGNPLQQGTDSAAQPVEPVRHGGGG